jgi:hypothetical protein
MPFSQSTILSVAPPVYVGFQVSLTWTTSSPAGTWFQVYLDRELHWWGQTTTARIAVPSIGPVRVDIGTVLAGEEQTDFSSSLPVTSNRRAELTWQGGRFEGLDLAGFKVFGSATAGAAGTGGFGGGTFGSVDLTHVLADITAYPSGILTDGFGFGGFGDGTFGSAPSVYTWISDQLTRGDWTFAVIPYDVAGNLGTPALTGVTIICPPLPPALFADNTRLHYRYPASSGGAAFGSGLYGDGGFGGGAGGANAVTLYWLASPG